jgi:hypothetical protein
VRCDVIVRGRLRPGMRVGCDPGRIFLISAPRCSRVRADHREAEAAAGLSSLPFPLGRKRSSERPGAVKGAPLGAAKRTLDGEDRSETIAEEGKQMWTPVDFLKRGQAKRLRCACVNHGSISDSHHVAQFVGATPLHRMLIAKHRVDGCPRLPSCPPRKTRFHR